MIQRRSVAREIRFHNIQIPVEVVVGRRNPHPGLRFAVGAEGATCFHSDVYKFAVLFILIQRARRGIVGHVNVRPAIVIEISG